MHPPDPTQIRELIADSQAEFLLHAKENESRDAARRLRELREERAAAVKRVAIEKGYNAPVLAVMEQIERLEAILSGRGADWTAAPGYARLAAKLNATKRERIAALHEDEDVRRIFHAYFDAEQPIKEACKRGAGSER